MGMDTLNNKANDGWREDDQHPRAKKQRIVNK